MACGEQAVSVAVPSNPLVEEIMPNIGRASLAELLKAIDKCKDLVFQTSPMSDVRRQLVRRLVELRRRVQELKEGDGSVPPVMSAVMDHQFVVKGKSLPERRYCECCGGLIWAIVQPWYFCRLCGYYVHAKCVESVRRPCASVLAVENPVFESEICPERGLFDQNFACAECKALIALDPAAVIPQCSAARLCHYAGLYFCETCHWNDEMVIPARVLHNWDFSPRSVCRRSKQFLRLMQKRPILRVEAINASLFHHDTGLFDVKRMRYQLMLMKPYLRSCRQAATQCLIAQLRPYAHFIDSQDVYSVQDLMDINNNVAQSQLKGVLENFARHIRKECEICRGNGFLCELCNDPTVLYPFDESVARCVQCFWIYHRGCFNRNNGVCPRCQRFARRTSLSALCTDE